ncbi:MAG: hypothetical protein Q4C70_11635 [Planctomycetia bacterium]|nr:hypothetical protein [Planctomycetia bacterium]
MKREENGKHDYDFMDDFSMDFHDDFHEDFRVDFHDEFSERDSSTQFFESSVSFLSSLIFHVILLIVMLLFSITMPKGPGRGPQLSMEFATAEEEEAWEDFIEESGILVEAQSMEDAEEELKMEELLPDEAAIETETDIETDTEIPEEAELDETEETESKEEVTEEVTDAEEALNMLDWTTVSPVDPDRTGKETPTREWAPEALQSGGKTNWNQQAIHRALPTGGGLGPRTNASERAQMLAAAGGNAQSESAVEKGLAWIVRHQQFDPEKRYFGSWNFDLSRHGIRNPGEATSRTAATALALLALLGHGNTREQGEYQKPVQDGIYYLSTQAKARATQPGYDLRDSPDSRGMYGHILATLALCEAYAMEEKKDPTLKMLAQGCLQWLLYAQDPEGGGWRYQPKEAGDVSITTWVIMVLKSAQMAGFEIPSQTLIKMDRFLDSIASKDKSKYSYQPGIPPIASTTAMGLCARVFTGSPRESEFLDTGTRQIIDWGCDETDLYHDYYATLLLRHYGGPRWKVWNEEMRDYLVLTQETTGKEAGSWYFNEPEKTNNQIGGRLYTTALSVMILEVYYRYLPVYGEM